MNKHKNKDNPVTRRSIFPLLGSTLLIPVLGFGNTDDKASDNSGDDEFQIVLKADGSVVKIRKGALQKSKVIKKNISNSKLLNWLGKKL